MNSVILFGKIPPPIGGVTRSVENLYTSLKSKNIEVEVFSKESLLKFRKFDVAHIHYSKSWKRLLGFVIGKLLAKKVIFTLHGRVYKKDFFNWLSSKLFDGGILLNEEANKEYKNLFKNSEQIGSMFKEGFNLESQHDKKYFIKEEKYKYLLVYSHSKIIENGYDVYGIDFILNNLEQIPSKYKLVLVDPTNSYDVSNYQDRIVHLNKEIDFKTLLKEIDIYLRPTIKDGDSVAVQEALIMNKNVITSNIVTRPQGVLTYKLHDFDDFLNILEKSESEKINFEANSINKYLRFCKKIGA